MDKMSLDSDTLSSDNVSSDFELVNPDANTNSFSSSDVSNSIQENESKDSKQKEVPISKEYEYHYQTVQAGISITNTNTNESSDALKEAKIDERPTTLAVPTTLHGDSDSDKTPTKTSYENVSQLDEDCISFNKVFYLGCSAIYAPRSEEETIKFISSFKSQLQTTDLSYKKKLLPSVVLENNDDQSREIEIVLSLPRKFNGSVRLLNPINSRVIASFELCKILFCVRGHEESADNDCFAFNEASKAETFQCHVFRCAIPEAVRKVMSCFESAFQATPESLEVDITHSELFGKKHLKRLADTGSEKNQTVITPSGDATSPATPSFDRSVYEFLVSLEIKEDDGKGGFATVPWDKTSSCFKFRSNLQKQVIVTVLQTNNVHLTIERCFGVLLTPGRNVKQSDMHLLDMERDVSADDVDHGGSHSVMGIWNPSQPHFTLLNTETQKGTRVFLSVAVDFVVQEIRDPVRFLIETKARIFPQNEKFWYFGRKILQEIFYVRLKDIEDADKTNSRQLFGVESIETESSRAKRFQTSFQPHQEQSLSSSCPQDEEDDDDTDEPLLSGSGEVNKECSDRVLSDWGIVLNRWRADLSRRPTGIRALVRSGSGVPDPLRGEVWQLLAGCHDNSAMLENYRGLITQDSSQENIIQRDVHRTFPAHDYFRSVGGNGQDSLYRISKAYSVFDREVGYCQGLSFLAAALLLHIPEEQAFCVLVKVMYDYKMRNLFKNGFEDLHLKFYQLERLTEEQLPSLNDHFKQLSIECHMFSSQWFLTLFTAKFPLNMVFHVIDIFLCEGELVVFKVALGLLECCRHELLALDFEGVLKYFRVQLPKKYRTDDQVKLLIQAAVNAKVSRKKLDRYEKDYVIVKEKMELEVDPLIRIERKNKQLMESNMRLELENDEIAQELVSTRVTLNTQLHRTMEHANILQRDLQGAINELRSTRTRVNELTDENNRLHDETKQVKEMCRREMARQEEDIVGKEKIINDYKTICSQMSKRIEKLQTSHKEEIEVIKKTHAEPAIGDASHMDLERRSEKERERLTQQIRDLELQLAQTKLKLVESECKVQDVEHQLMSTSKELQSSKNTWFQKTLSTLTAKKPDATFLTGPTVPSLPSNQNKPPGHVTTTVTSFGRHQLAS